jgi:transcriptional regulator with XRE-family HTH domain
MDVARTLKILRLFHNMTQAELAQKLSISKSYLSEIESGSKRINLEILGTYSTVFKVPISQILLFSESVKDHSIAEKARTILSKKFLNILEWMAKDAEK